MLTGAHRVRRALAWVRRLLSRRTTRKKKLGKLEAWIMSGAYTVCNPISCPHSGPRVLARSTASPPAHSDHSSTDLHTQCTHSQRNAESVQPQRAPDDMAVGPTLAVTTAGVALADRPLDAILFDMRSKYVQYLSRTARSKRSARSRGREQRSSDGPALVPSVVPASLWGACSLHTYETLTGCDSGLQIGRGSVARRP